MDTQKPEMRSDRLRNERDILLEALHRIAITDDADCKIAGDAKAMTQIAREALAKVNGGR